jgi:hypothetical protein
MPRNIIEPPADVAAPAGDAEKKVRPMNKFRMILTGAVLAAVVMLVPHAWARSHDEAVFKYVAGTEPMPKDCTGKLEVKASDLVFKCEGQSLAVPYSAITRMEFRPRVSKRICKMKLAWAIKPTSAHGKHDGFFTVLYSANGQTHAIILRVRKDTMRPYMAEIDLKTGHPIESRQD